VKGDSAISLMILLLSSILHEEIILFQCSKVEWKKEGATVTKPLLITPEILG
jgi:hypothetical protein